MAQGAVVGRPQIRIDASSKVQGKARYVADLQADSAAHGAILRSPYHHARILAIDTSQAQVYPGVLAVLTAANIHGRNGFGVIIPDQPVLAEDVVRFQGEAVALVVAESERTARQALALVHVEYEPLPPVFDPEAALASDSLSVHPQGNLLGHRQIRQGDVEASLAAAEIVVRAEFETPFVDHGYLEPEAALAERNEDGSLTVWASSQHPYRDRAQIAASLQLPEERVRVINPAVGGAFGGKDDITVQILAALGALATRRAVRLVNTREESILSHSKRHAARMHYELGSNKEGRLVALRARILCDTGAYASFGPSVGGLMTELAAGPYRIPNVAIDTYIVHTNNPVGGAMRGFGAPQVNFAMESCMDILARRLGMDSIDLRLKNCLRTGDAFATGYVLEGPVSMAACLERARRARDRLAKTRRATHSKAFGVGVASSVLSIGYGPGIPDKCATELEWLADGGVLLHQSSPDLGQGLETAAAQFAAEALDLPLDKICLTLCDTGTSPDSGASNASRMTYLLSNSIPLSAKDALALLLAEASKALHIPVEELVYRRGVVHSEGDPEERVSSGELAQMAAETGRRLSGRGTFDFPYSDDLPTELGPGLPHTIFCFGAQVAAVEVDVDLGTVAVTDVVAIHDLGKVVNPPAAAGQIEGGVGQGVGYALSEELQKRETGHWANTFAEYLLPTALDTPRIETEFIEYPEPSSPFGAKGVGEQGTVATASAIANAIADAVGVRVTKLPVDPEIILRQSTPRE